jgi:hypothetical protein
MKFEFRECLTATRTATGVGYFPETSQILLVSALEAIGSGASNFQNCRECGQAMHKTRVTETRRIIAPAETSWDDFFDAPGVDLGTREQPAMQERERF